jgi:hypothetical protein
LADGASDFLARGFFDSDVQDAAAATLVNRSCALRIDNSRVRKVFSVLVAAAESLAYPSDSVQAPLSPRKHGTICSWALARCSTMQYTFPDDLRLACPFKSEGEKLQTTNKIRHFKHFC